jgi:hypothetical protein
MQTHLFIGGAHDGLNSPVADGQDEARIPVGVTDSEVYIRDSLSVGDASFTIYRHEALTSAQVLDRMVAYYVAWSLNRPDGHR